MKRRRLVYVIGPSGAGKDSVLRWVSEHAPRGLDLHVARRTISRAANDPSEDHEAVSVAEFQRLASEGAFALHWEANELQYGVRHAELDPLRRGAWVLVNGSRAYLPQARQRFPGLVVAYVYTSPDVLRARLLARGRETPEQIEARLARSQGLVIPSDQVDVVIDNDGTLAQAGQQLLTALQHADCAADRPPD